MGNADERRVIETRMVEEWGTRTPIHFEEDSREPDYSNPFVVFLIRPASTRVVGMGNGPLNRSTGLIIAQIFSPSGQGTADAREYADLLGAIFDNKAFDVITCGPASTTVVGRSGSTFQVNVSVPYERDDP